MKEVYGNATLDISTIQLWYKCFREGSVSTEDNPQSGHPSTAIDNSSIAIIATVLDKDRQVLVREVVAETGIQQTAVHCILTEQLFKKKVAAWWVPHTLTDIQKEMSQNCTRMFKVVQKRRKAFESDNCYQHDMDMRYRA